MTLNLDFLTKQLHLCPIGHTIDYYQSIPSTMPVAHALAAQPATRSGTLVIAEEQTAGRGRLQRRWEAPPGQALLLSIILKPPLPVPVLLLPMLIGVAAVRALASLAPTLTGHVGIKWPNDLLVGNNMADAGKVAGILVESAFQGTEPAYVIVGIGINVNQAADSLPPAQPGAPPPTSLRLYAGTVLDRHTVLVALCQTLGALCATPISQMLLSGEWRAHLWTLGQWVVVRERGMDDDHFSGQAVDVTATGGLVVEDSQGQRRLFSAGDVTVRTV